jgi:hypothetical protein
LADIKYWSGPATGTTGTGTFTPGQVAAGNAQVLSSASTAFTLTSGNGTNTTTWQPTLVVIVPLTAAAGVYTGTITQSVT